jgi:uncharacterized damage-inducible protein DinB
MSLYQYLIQLYDYNYWANRRMMKAARGLIEEQLHRQQGHSWGSVYDTLLHIMNAEWLWLSRWKGSSPSVFPTRDDYPTLGAMDKRWAELEAEMRAFVNQQTDDSLVREIAYRNTRREAFRLPLWQMMAHLPNHGTHHRGELAAMLAMIDVPHEEEDWLYYFLERSGQRL